MIIGQRRRFQLEASKPLLIALCAGVHAFGHTDAGGCVLHERCAEGKFDRFPVLAKDPVQNRPDVPLVSTTPASSAAKAASSSVPIVIVLEADPVGAGIVQSLAREVIQ